MTAAFKHCRYCTERYPGCHGSCEKYKEDREDWDRKIEYLNSDKEIQAYTEIKKYQYMDRQAKEKR